jgi:imidazolonepropionase-like amidohydrolase
VHVTVAWDKPRTKHREQLIPVEQTQIIKKEEGYDFHCPKVLAILPAKHLCASAVAWQQVPAAENQAAAWFDQHLSEQFPGSLKHIASKAVEAHLYDRPATYAKIYGRYGEEKYLLAALQSNEFYIQHLGPDGFFKLKPGDFKYIYSEGSALMYMLTGDERFRDAVNLGLVGWSKWKRIEYTGKDFWTERHAGTGLAAYLHAYELSGDPAQLAMARRYFEAVLSLQVHPLDGKPSDGAWLHTADSHGDGNGWTSSAWMSALLMDSIWKLWQVSGDERCPMSLAMYSKFAQKNAITPDGKGVYYMVNSPGRGKSEDPESPPHNMEACYVLAMGYYLSGGSDESLLASIEKLWPPLMNDGANAPGRKFNWRFRETSMLVWFLQNAKEAGHALRPMHDPPGPANDNVVAIVGATIIDGTGTAPISDGVVIVKGNRIEQVGPRAAVKVLAGAAVVDGTRLTLLPGLIDAHFHLDRRNDRPGVFLRHGVTSVRDPGAWIEAYEAVRRSSEAIPRLFLTGPHLDCDPVAYPRDAVVVNTPEEAKAAVNRAADEGGVAIKVYFRMPIELIKATTEAAHARGIPVTGHLELVSAVDAINAGLDGIEHVTSFGTSLAAPDVVEKFTAAVRASNAARDPGRYELWGTLDLDHCPRLAPTLDLAVQKHTVLCPTLAVFELRAGDKKATPAKLRGYENMLKFTGLYHKAGGTVVVGSHSEVPHAEYGWAYPRELELLVNAGLSNMDVIKAATLDGATYFRVADELGSIEKGKLADLVMVDGDPLKDIRAMRKVKRVMLNGFWVDLTPPPLGKGELIHDKFDGK